MQPLLLLDRGDRALFVRCADHARSRLLWKRAWTLFTHLGGARVTTAACVIPLLFGRGAFRTGAQGALWALVISHLIVQLIKRSVQRPRPSSGEAWTALAKEPDQFSFPSGHATAAMAVAFSFGTVFPAIAPILIALAMIVGLSRVFLGVHYPGDVFIGQAIAVVTVLLL